MPPTICRQLRRRAPIVDNDLLPHTLTRAQGEDNYTCERTDAWRRGKHNPHHRQVHIKKDRANMKKNIHADTCPASVQWKRSCGRSQQNTDYVGENELPHRKVFTQMPFRYVLGKYVLNKVCTSENTCCSRINQMPQTQKINHKNAGIPKTKLTYCPQKSQPQIRRRFFHDDVQDQISSQPQYEKRNARNSQVISQSKVPVHSKSTISTDPLTSLQLPRWHKLPRSESTIMFSTFIQPRSFLFFHPSNDADDATTTVLHDNTSTHTKNNNLTKTT
jgi:hypothetical protein